MAENTKEKAPLDDIMLAMDVVDTLRYQQLLVDRELNSEDRDKLMIERLRQIYKSQGITVPDEVLEQGVESLKEGRFVYTPPAKSFNTWLASLYIRRAWWGKISLASLLAIVLLWCLYFFLVVKPAEQKFTELPQQLDAYYQQIKTQTKVPLAEEEAAALLEQGKLELSKKDSKAATTVLEQMKQLLAELNSEYVLRIVSRQGERSGVWRIPNINTQARNYYIIVEAITPKGQVLTLPILNEEDGKTYSVNKWGIRVDHALFDRIAADKKDDGIIQNNIFGIKKKGYLKPEYRMQTPGGTITSW